MELAEDLPRKDRRLLLNGNDLDGILVADHEQIRDVVHAITTTGATQIRVVRLG